MVKLHRLSGGEVTVNAELIETVESVPDTLIVLSNGNRLFVHETVAEVTARVLAWRREVAAAQETRFPSRGGA